MIIRRGWRKEGTNEILLVSEHPGEGYEDERYEVFLTKHVLKDLYHNTLADVVTVVGHRYNGTMVLTVNKNHPKLKIHKQNYDLEKDIYEIKIKRKDLDWYLKM